MRGRLAARKRNVLRKNNHMKGRAMYKRIFGKARFAALLLSLVILISALPLNVIAAAPDTSEAETDTVIPDERSSYTDSELTEEEINATGDTSLYIGVDDFCEATRDGAIYSFANSASNKYLTVGISGNGGYYDDGEIDEIEGTNVYQSAKSGLLSQAFRLDYDTELECFRIRAMCVNNGYGSVLDYPSESYNDSSYGNLRIYSYDESWSDDQGWVIIAYNNSDLFRISPAYDTDLAVTACGTADGSESGTSMTSPGNVYVTEFTGATNQLWRLESGGIQVVNGIDIREAHDNGSNYANVSENSTTLSLCCPVDSTDANYITWTSSNMSVATVNSIGKVTAKKAGLATITASVSYDGDDGCDVYTFTVYVVLKDGTYYFNNAKNDLRLEFKYSNAYSESSPLEAYNSGTTEPPDRFRMFKIKYVGSGYYVIRSMVDCSMGWTCPDSSSTELVATTIGTSDNSVQTRSKWRIQSNANGYYIFNCAYGTKKTIASPSSSGNIRLEQYTYSTNQPNDKLQNWVIKEITSEHHGVTLTSNADTVGVGGSYRFKAAVHSTYTGEYGQRGYTWSVTNGTGSATVDSYGVVTGVSVGTVVLKVTYRVNSSTQWTFSRTIHIIPFAEGTYYIKNVYYGSYVQVDDNDAPNYSTNGGKAEIHLFDGGKYQRWVITHIENGYYKITSNVSGYAITVPSGSENADNVDLVLKSYTGSDNQKWKISRTSHGSYKIKAKSSESYTTKDLAMNLESYTSYTNGLKIRQKEYVSDTNYRDEWAFTRIQYTARVYNYYDMGYPVRYSETAETSVNNIDSYINAISTQYLKLFGLELTAPSAVYYKSPIDSCKKTVSISNIDTLCSHGGTVHTERNNVASAFKSYHDAQSQTTYILWSCHKITSTATNGNINYNRSCSSGNSIFLIKINTTDRNRYSAGVLMHELNHQYGAKDHYHELADKNNQESCKFKEICSECGNNPRPRSCIMYNSSVLVTNSDVICAACQEDIIARLNKYNQK